MQLKHCNKNWEESASQATFLYTTNKVLFNTTQCFIYSPLCGRNDEVKYDKRKNN